MKVFLESFIGTWYNAISSAINHIRTHQTEIGKDVADFTILATFGIGIGVTTVLVFGLCMCLGGE